MNPESKESMMSVFVSKQDLVHMIKGVSLTEKSLKFLQMKGIKVGGDWISDSVFDKFDVYQLGEIYKTIQSDSLMARIETIDALNQVFSTNASLKFRYDLLQRVKQQHSVVVIKRIQSMVDRVENVIKNNEITNSADGVIIGTWKTANKDVLAVDENYDVKQGRELLYHNNQFSTYFEQWSEQYFGDIFIDFPSTELVVEYKVTLLKMINIDLFDDERADEISKLALGKKYL